MPALVGVCKGSFAAQRAFGLLCLVAVLGSDPLTKKEIPLLWPGSLELFWVATRGTNAMAELSLMLSAQVDVGSQERKFAFSW